VTVNAGWYRKMQDKDIVKGNEGQCRKVKVNAGWSRITQDKDS
jgi:hypothetical protein